MKVYLPVAVDVAGAEREGVVHERGVHGLLAALRHVQQVGEVAQVAVAAAHAVPRTVLVQHEHLSRWEPALGTEGWWLEVDTRFDDLRSAGRSNGSYMTYYGDTIGIEMERNSKHT